MFIIIHLFQECWKIFSSFWNQVCFPASIGEPVFAAVQPSLHKERSCVPVLFNPPTSMSFSTNSFHLFFGRPFFKLSTANLFAFTGVLSSSILSTSLNHCNLCSLSNSSIICTPVISRIVSLLMPSLNAFPQIICNILISVVNNFFSSFFFQCLALGAITQGPSHTTFMHLPRRFRNTIFYKTPAIFWKFFIHILF